MILGLCFSANALNGGCDLELAVTPDGLCKPGDIIDFSLSGAHEDNHGFIFMGVDLGPYTFYKWELGLIPTSWLYLGPFPASEEIALSVALPDPFPPGMAGTVFHMQGTSAGMGCCGWKYLVSNLEVLEFE